VYALAERLHLPVYRLVAEMPAQEFGRWLAFFELQQQDRECPPDKRAELEQWFQLE
jgi:hypothetical protein